MYSCKDQDVRGTLLLTRSDSDRWVIAAVRVLNSYVEYVRIYLYYRYQIRSKDQDDKDNQISFMLVCVYIITKMLHIRYRYTY